MIGFTVALAGVVITWGGGFVDRIVAGTDERTTETFTCVGDLKFEIAKVKCPDLITIENKGKTQIEDFTLRFFNSNGELTGDSQSVGEELEKYKIKEFKLGAKIPKGTTKVEALANIIVDGQEITCGDSTKSKSFTPACL